MALFVLRKPILQMRKRSHPVGLDVWCLVGPFIYFHNSCVRTTKALARLRGCAGSPEPSLVAYVINTIIAWAAQKYHVDKKFPVAYTVSSSFNLPLPSLWYCDLFWFSMVLVIVVVSPFPMIIVLIRTANFFFLEWSQVCFSQCQDI